MAGGGGGRYIGPPSPNVEERIRKAFDEEQQRLDGDVNALLRGYLGTFNSRDRELTKERLDVIAETLGDRASLDRIMLGGSVAKHTEVNGLSDVDALVVLDRDDLRGASAAQVKEAFFKALSDGLRRHDIEEIRQGRLAVTVRYRDGMEIQLLPAIKKRASIAVPSGEGGSWNETDPRAFQRELGRVNDRLNKGLVPAVKLMKAAISRFPEQKRLSGYHVEALAVEAARRYRGPTTPRALLVHLLGSAATRVLQPLQDATGQSRLVDTYLGKARSPERRNIALALAGLQRRLASATTVAEWRAVLEE